MIGPQEFSPEIQRDFLSSEYRGIDEEGAIGEGRAEAESNSRGLSGQAMQGSLVGMSRARTSNQRNSAVSDLNYKLAGMSRDERLINQKEAWHLEDQSNSAEQAQLDRQNRENLQAMGFAFQDSQRNNQNRASKIQGEQGMLMGAGLEIATTAIGGAAGAYHADKSNFGAQERQTDREFGASGFSRNDFDTEWDASSGDMGYGPSANF